MIDKILKDIKGLFKVQDKAKFLKQNIPYLAFFYVGNIFSHHVRAYTGGGIKTTTFGVLLSSTISVLRGNKETEIFHKTIPYNTLIKSLCIFTLGSFLVIFSSLWITLIEQGKFLYLDILYEIVSAFGTVGISRGITADLSSLSKIILIVLMYLGRVGAATLGVGILDNHRKKHTKYSEGKIIVG